MKPPAKGAFSCPFATFPCCYQSQNLGRFNPCGKARYALIDNFACGPSPATDCGMNITMNTMGIQDKDDQGNAIASHIVVRLVDANGVALQTLSPVADHVRVCWGPHLDLGDPGSRLNVEPGVIHAVTVNYIAFDEFHC